MRILICNDDGIHAPGIAALYKELSKIAEVTVVAPYEEQSAAGHAITVAWPLKAKFMDIRGQFKGWAVHGTPADCCKLGVEQFMKDAPPDLVVSGINHGSNTGRNIIYSGTVSAATEAVFLGIRAMAVSLCTFENKPFEPAAIIARKLVHKLLAQPLGEAVCLNVNVPAVPLGDIKGYRVTEQGATYYLDEFDERKDPRGASYYWLIGRRATIEEPLNSDQRAVDEGYISLSTIKYDLTDKPGNAILASWIDDLK